MKRFFKCIEEKMYITTFLLSIALAILCDIFCRMSFVKSITFIIEEPLILLLNTFLIYLSFLIAGFMRRRAFYVTFISIIWILIGLANGIILMFRNTPFTFQDIEMIQAGLLVMNNYMSNWMVLLIFVLSFLLIVGIVIAFFRFPKSKKKYNLKKGLIVSGIAVLAYTSCYHIAIASDKLEKRIVNLNISYKSFGMPYCFITTALDRGIDRPTYYSNHKVDKVLKELPEDSSEGAAPNIIYLQLESFFDVKHIKGLEYSSDPTPTFTDLKETYSSGFFKVPAYGAGTINTEFEVLTGMNHNYFGAGEYPYKSVLSTNTCESINYNLKSLGYSTHAIHNNTATFYDRNTVFGNLGFDTFTSEEYMNVSGYTDSGWALDNVLTSEIMKTLKSTEEQDFIQAISVQGHGEYPADYELKAGDITITGMDNDIARKNKLTYYIQQINEMDLFLKALTDQLRIYDEDVILVIYGDHLPSLDFKRKQLDNDSIYETEYVIWNNFGLEKQDEDIEAYQLTAKVLGQLNIHIGTFTKYHQQFKGTGNGYFKNMKLLEYDALFGRQYIYEETNPFEVSNITMGIYPVTIDWIEKKEEGYLIHGVEFTKSSTLYLNDKSITTTFIDETTLRVEDIELNEGDESVIAQETPGGTILSTSSPYIF